MDLSLLAVVHLAATGFMAGLIWTIHVVHYPLFALVGEPYRPYQEAHMRRIVWLLVVPWGLEVLSAVALVVLADQMGMRVGAGLGLALLVAIVLVTGAGAAPMHGRLVERFDPDVLRRLHRVDSVRVALWSLRLVLAGYLVVVV